MDPITLGAMLMKAYKLGKFGAELWYGKHGGTLNNAIAFLQDYENSEFQDAKSLTKAISLLESIPDSEKDYLIAGRDYFLAVCYFYEEMYSASLRYLNNVEIIEINALTAAPQFIRDFQAAAGEFRQTVLNAIGETDSNEYDSDDQDNWELSQMLKLRDEFISGKFKSEKQLKSFIHRIRKNMNDSDDNYVVLNSGYIMAVVHLDFFIKEWLYNDFRNYKTQNDFSRLCKMCIEEGRKEIHEARESNLENNEYLIVSGTLCMLNDYWLESSRDKEFFIECYGELLNINTNSNLFNDEWLTGLFSDAYKAILRTCK